VTLSAYVIQTASGALIALDKASGGYPYHANSLSEIHYWKSFEDAYKYWQVFERSTATDEKWKIKQATLVVKGIPT
jgi:hypothetical protein